MPVRSKIAFAHLVLLFCSAWSSIALWAQQPNDPVSESIAIGLLVEDSIMVEGRYGAEFAIEELNRRGGLQGRQLVLAVKSMEGPWGVGSTKTVDLVFEHKVWALVGLVKGRNSHLVEQVAAKTNIPFISAWAADPTLAKAYVPQFFSCVPNSEYQGRALLNHLFEKQGSDNWILVSDDDYDSRIAVKSLINTEEFQKHPASEQFKCSSPDDFQRLLQGINESNPKALVVYCEPELSLELIRFLRAHGKPQPVYSSLSLLHEQTYSRLLSRRVEDLYFLDTGSWLTDRNSDFAREFHSRFGRYPGAMAAYAYDAIQILAEALKNSGTDPKKLKHSLSKTSYTGKTGHIKFDRYGNRKSPGPTGETHWEILSLPKP